MVLGGMCVCVVCVVVERGGGMEGGRATSRRAPDRRTRPA